MGQVISFDCKACGHNQRLSEGVGMLDSSLARAIDRVPEKDQSVVLAVLNRPDVKHVTYGRRHFACSKCRILTSRFDFNIEYSEGLRLAAHHTCERCASELVRPRKPYTRYYACEKCGERALSECEVMMNWD